MYCLKEQIQNIYKETKEISEEVKQKFSKIKEDFCFLFVGHWLSGNLGRR